MENSDNSVQYSFFNSDMNQSQTLAGNYVNIDHTLDELFHRSKNLRSSSKFFNYLKFVRKFKRYSIFNNTLVFLQNPNVTFYATPNHWKRKFGRVIKEDARPMVILAPMTPVVFVYDLVDTYGRELPEYIIDPFKTDGDIDPDIYDKTVENSKRDRIVIRRKDLSFLHGGTAAKYRFPTENKINNAIKAIITINSKFNTSQAYATLIHELAHIYLGHLGNDPDKWWPDRRGLTNNQVELEAESVSYLVCGRAGLKTKSDEYLAGYIEDENELKGISIELIAKNAAFLEKIGNQKLPQRKEKSKV